MEQAQPKAQQPKTYRVRQLPSHVDELQTVDLLVRLIDGLESRGDVQVFSLASNADPWERPPTKVATVGFPSAPAIFNDGSEEWVFPTASLGLFKNVIVDTHFLDFTVLNQVPRDEHTLTLIAISGLASHPFGSWRSRARGSNFMWLRDGLPKDLPGIRNILYGYDTKLLSSQSFQEIDDLAITLVIKLKSLGLASNSARPLIFVVHSLGGIIFKRAVVILANGNDAERAILRSIKSVLFFGAPNQGMTIAHLLPMVADQPNEALVKCLSVGSEYLKVLSEQFNGIAQLEKLRLISIYETAKSRTTKELSPGIWDRSGPYEILVERSSAIHPACRVTDTFPVDKDHSNMVKFSENDSNYRGILSYVHEVYEEAALRTVVAKSGSEGHIPQSNNEGEHNEITLNKQLDISSFTTECNPQQGSIHGVETASSHENPNVDEIIDACMKGLYSEESEFRVKNIDDAVGATYEWILDDPALGFVDWLQQQEGIFWISGKPGSGKSTLMKYISNNQRAKQYLSGGSHSGHHVLASFFFHDRGSAIQKSFEGLLRSILYQILRAEPALQKQILSNCTRLHRRHPPYWHLGELEDLFRDIVNQDMHHIDVTLLLDALDEYEGSLPLFVDFLKSSIERKPASTTRVKICFSSRQWPIFEEHFQHCEGLKIHEHTSQDMLEFIDDRKSRTRSLTRLMSTTIPADREIDVTVAQCIVQKAQGVFLWVKLTMDALSRWATDGFSPNEIIDVLSKIPGDLETFYEHILNKIDPAYRMECYVMLEIALRSEATMGLYQFSMAVSCAFQSTINECETIVSGLISSAIDKSVPMPKTDGEEFERRIRSRCGGMLEVVEVNGNLIVQLMHQTVREFVSRPRFKKLALGENSSLCIENGYSYLSKYHLAIFTGVSSAADLRIHSSRLLDDCGYYAHKAETTTGTSNGTFLRSIKNSYFRYKGHRAHVRQEIGTIDSVSTFAVAAGLQLFLAEHLQRNPLSINGNPGVPFLHCAVENLALYLNGRRESWSKRDEKQFDQSTCDMVEFLINHGADATIHCNGMTAIQYLVHRSSILFSATHKPISLAFFPENGILAALTLLRHSDNSTTLVELENRDRVPSTSTSTLLHVASCLWFQAEASTATRVLLQQGADVNSVNSSGGTPLDQLITSSRSHGGYKAQDRPDFAERAFTIATLLIDAGARVRPGTLHRVNSFLMWLEAHHDISALRRGLFKDE